MRISDWSSDVCSSDLVAHVTLIEFDDKLRADEVLQAKLRSLPNVDVIVSALTTEVLGDGEQVVGLTYDDRTSGEQRKVDLDGIFVQIGLLPNTEWLEGSVELSPRGEIVIDDRGHTSVPGRSEEHTSELQSLMRISYAVFCLKKK